MDKKNIVIIDYQLGNIRSVQHAFRSIGYPVVLSDDPEVIKKAAGVVLPGVGGFRDGIRRLSETHLDQLILELINREVPFLGICLGMQLLFTYSEEHGIYKGLGVIPGKVVRFPDTLKVPHLGWNQVCYSNPFSLPGSILFKGIQDKSYFYFVHSYYCVPDLDEDILAKTEYQQSFASAVNRKNIFGVQFHPEKSSFSGLKLLKNFGEKCFDYHSGH